MRLSLGLGSKSLLGACIAVLAGCTCLTEPVSEELARGDGEPGGTAAAAPPAPAPSPSPAKPTPAAPARVAKDTITTSHILVSYQGAARSKVTRSKDEAKQRAAGLLARVRKGGDFGELAAAESDDPSAKANRGSLGTVPATSFVKPYADAALALRPGQISDLVESPFGFHIIKRDK